MPLSYNYAFDSGRLRFRYLELVDSGQQYPTIVVVLGILWLEIATLFGFVERHEKLRIAMSADRSVRKESSRTLKTNDESRQSELKHRNRAISMAWVQEAVTGNVVDLEIAFDSHAYAD